MENEIDRLKAALADRYTILGELGAGGMATVYLAEDVKHHRKVALKVLRPELAAILGGERFLKEIEVTANLQHPNILPLYDSGEADNFLYYVMPFLEGESLRDTLNREKQLSIDETIEIGRAVAGALHYAHERNIIHRDIKPENILMQSGQAMVADFGIALAVSEAGGTRLTQTGLSLGTPHYMSPEQASGDRQLDGRTDQYSLAVTLYESFAGEPPFNAPSAQAIVAKILTEKPPLAIDVRDSVPRHVAAAIQKALEKLPADRFHTAAEFADALANPGVMSVASSAGFAVDRGGPPTTGWRARLPWMVSIAAIALATVAISWRNPTPPSAPNPLEFVVRFDQTINQTVALSSDGQQLAMSGRSGGLLMRNMSSLNIAPHSSSEGRVWAQPVFSPDGEWVAFLDIQDRELKRAPTNGGVSVPITEIRLFLFGLTWGPTDTIIFGRGFSGLWAAPVAGGMAEQLTVPDTALGELGHWHPQYLPGGTKVLFSTYRAPFDSASVEILDLNSRERTVLLQGGAYARYVATGHIIYSRGETLWAVPFDIDRFRVTGSAVPVREVFRTTQQMQGADSRFPITERSHMSRPRFGIPRENWCG